MKNPNVLTLIIVVVILLAGTLGFREANHSFLEAINAFKDYNRYEIFYYKSSGMQSFAGVLDRRTGTIQEIAKYSGKISYEEALEMIPIPADTLEALYRKALEITKGK